MAFCGGGSDASWIASFKRSLLCSSNIISKRLGDLQSKGEVLLVIYISRSWYDIRAFNRSGKRIPRLCFRFRVRDTSFPFYCAIVVVGSTLYMIGGRFFSTTAGEEVYNLATLTIDLDMAPEFSNSPISDHVRIGPCLNAPKLFPILVVVGNRIYAFERHPYPTQSLPNFEFLDTSDGPFQQWTELPELPIPMNVGDIGYVEIVSHIVDEEDRVIILSLSGRKYNGVFMLDLRTHTWSLLCPDTPPSCHGEVVSLHGVNYALKRHYRDSDNVVCCFDGSMAPLVVQEVLDLPPPPPAVYCQPHCKIVLIGDTLFVVRIGYDCMGNSFIGPSDITLIIDRFQICVEEKKSRAINFRRKIYTLDDTGGFDRGLEGLYCVSWARRSKKKIAA